jgi:hypothetical protein
MKFLIPLLLLAAAACAQSRDQFPDAPEPVKPSLFGGWEKDRFPGVRQPVFTKKFIAAHAAFLGSTIFDVEMTQHCIHRGTCVEGNGESRREGRVGMYTNDLIPFAVLTGFDALIQWGHPPKAFRWLPYLAPAYGTVVHLRGGIKGIKYY